MSAYRETKRRVQLLSDVIAVFEEFNREQGQVAALDETRVYFLLLGRYGGERQGNREDVVEVLALLGSHLNRALQRTPEGYVFTRSLESCAPSFHADCHRPGESDQLTQAREKNMKPWTITFLDGNEARAVHVPNGAEGTAIAAALELPPPRAVLMISGGASDMSPAEMVLLRALLAEGIARVAVEESITLIDGGTQAGVMRMVGEGHAAWGGAVPLIGVCPAALVTWPGGPAGGNRVPLEPNHTHFVLTEGDQWGAETETMFALAAALSDSIPSVAVLANGGPIARDEMLHNVRQGREIIVIAGSGRFADELTAVVRGVVEPADAGVAEIVRDGRITLFDIADGPEALAALVRQRLFGKAAT